MDLKKHELVDLTLWGGSDVMGWLDVRGGLDVRDKIIWGDNRMLGDDQTLGDKVPHLKVPNFSRGISFSNRNLGRGTLPHFVEICF